MQTAKIANKRIALIIKRIIIKYIHRWFITIGDILCNFGVCYLDNYYC